MKLPWFLQRPKVMRQGLSESSRELLDPASSADFGNRLDVNGDVGDHRPPVQPAMAPGYRTMQDKHITGDTIECPTCQGKGKLSQGQADSMVALIPVKDERLRPRRTKLYIGLTVGFCVLAFGLIAVFLMPRSVSLSILSVKSYNVSITSNVTQVPYIDMLMKYRVQNRNFFSVDLSGLTIQVLWNKAQLSINYTVVDFSVGPRRSIEKTILMRSYFNGTQGTNVRKVCLNGWKWGITEKFSASAYIVYLGRGEQISFSKFQFVDCYGVYGANSHNHWT